MARLEVPINPKLGIRLKEDPISLDGDCVDPFARLIIEEALDFAIETSQKRFKRVGKVFSKVEAKGQPTLQIIQDIRDAIGKLPLCERELTPKERTQVRKEIKEKKAERAEKLKEAERAARPEKLTSVVWNTMPIAERTEMAQQAKLEGKRGAAAFGSFTKEEVAALEKAYAYIQRAKARPPEPPKEPQLKLIAIKMADEKDPKIIRQVGWGIVEREGEAFTSRISTEEGIKLLGEGKARVV